MILVQVSLELGGKSPQLVFESADIDQGTLTTPYFKNKNKPIRSSSDDLTFARGCETCVPAATNWAALGILYNTGQDCTAGSRVYVQDTIYDKFVATLIDKAKALVIGDGFDEESGGGPVVRTLSPICSESSSGPVGWISKMLGTLLVMKMWPSVCPSG